ncbi:Suppressor of fused [Blattella germanica]|nr:Suppressor of fused [Blattella germanica]
MSVDGCILSSRSNQMTVFPPTPLGLEALYSQCRRIYPDQVNPLQVTALVKYCFGLSDLHGDGRVHDSSGPDTPRNTLCVGDHVSWHTALDNSESRIQHMLMTEDPQLRTVQTPFGCVKFVQIVGVCREELQASQHWNGGGVLEILKRLPGAGGPWLITDMRRGESMLELDLAAQEEVEKGIETDGSNLSGVSARCSWADVNVQQLTSVEGHAQGEGGVLREGPSNDPSLLDVPHISEQDSLQIKMALKKGLLNSKPVLPPIGKTSELDSNDNPYKRETFDSGASNELGVLESTELLRSKTLEGLHLTFNQEAGSILPLAVRGRLKHGRHFTFKSLLGDTAITFVTPTVTGSLVDSEHPYVAHGPWLQVLIPDELAEQMSQSFEVLSGNSEELSLPKTFLWVDHKLAISIVDN